MMLSWVYGIEQSYIIEEKNIFKKNLFENFIFEIYSDVVSGVWY